MIEKYEVKIKKLPKSEVELEALLPAASLDSARKKALEIFALSLEVPGFRKGHVPENLVVEHVGEARILEEAANLVLKEHFYKITEQEKLDILGHPKISITKLALGNPLEFKAVFAVMPELELPKYKEVAKSAAASAKQDSEEPTEKEVEEVLLQIRRNKAHFDWHQAHPEAKGHDPARMPQAGGHPEIDDKHLAELNDEFAQAAGNFKNLDELKEKVRQNIAEEKKLRNIEKKRAAIMEELLKKTEIDLPDILVESENEKALSQLKADVERMGAKFEDYLSQVKKTEDDLRKDFRASSEKKAKIQLIFNKIAEAEKLEPNKEILENEVKNILEHYKDANQESARIYVATLLLNQEVLKLLENRG